MNPQAAQDFAAYKFKTLGMGSWYCHIFGEDMFRKIEKIEREVKKSRGEVVPRGRRLVGACYNDGTSSWIALRRKYVLEFSTRKIKKIILHEIAHAIRGNGFGHDEKFRACARSLGAYVNDCI